MLSRFFEALYQKVFINIVVKGEITDVYIEIYSRNSESDNVKKSFESPTLNNEMFSFISEYAAESPYSYISVLDSSLSQGAIPTCDKSRLPYYCDVSESEYKCQDGKWTYYTSKTDLYKIEKTYKSIGVDFIFSPFSVLAMFFKDKIDSHLALFIIIQEHSISLCVFENSKLLYAQHLDVQTSEANDDMLLSSISNDDDEMGLDDIDLEDMSVVDDMEDLEDLEAFGDIEDIESLEEIDEFSKNEDIEEEFYEAQEVFAETDENMFSEDYQMFSLIQNSLRNFYDDEKYESKFIENVYMADSVGISIDLKKYLEEEMFLNVYVRSVDLSIEVSNLAKMELNI